METSIPDPRAVRRPRVPVFGSAAPEVPSDLPRWVEGLGDNARNLRLLVEPLKSPVGIVPFVGAGLSVPFGYPGWRSFLEAQASDAVTRRRIERLLDRGDYEEAAELHLRIRGADDFHAVLAGSSETISAQNP